MMRIRSAKIFFRVMGVVAVGAAISMLPGSANADANSPYLTTFVSGYNFQNMQMSADGTKIIISAPDQRLVYSVDSGQSWTTQSGSGNAYDGGSPVLSRSGNLAYSFDGGWVFYTTSDLTQNYWPYTNNSDAMQGAWVNAGTSGDGSFSVIANNSTGFITTADSGATYSKYLQNTNHSWGDVRVANDASQFLLAMKNSKDVITSVDQGITLVTKHTPIPFAHISMALNSPDNLFGMSTNGQAIYHSSDFGTSWQLMNLGFTGHIANVAVTDDSSKLVVATNNNGVWSTIDNGTSWVQELDNAHPWAALAVDQSGTQISVGASDGTIGTVSPATSHLVTVTSCDSSANGSLGTLSYALNFAESDPDMTQIQFSGAAEACTFDLPNIVYSTPIRIVGPIDSVGQPTITFNKSNFTGDMFSSVASTRNDLSITNINFTADHSQDVSGSYINTSGTVTVTNVNMSHLANGSAIDASQSIDQVLHINHSSFSSNHTSGQGAAINAAGTVWIDSSTFTDNTSASGGALYLLGGAHIGNSAFTRNSALHGGAIYSSTTSDWTWVDNSQFTSNAAAGALDSNGGAYAGSSNLGLGADTFHLNTAQNGGALAFEIAGWSPDFNTDNFSNNSAAVDGGAVFTDTEIRLNYDTTFSHNSAGYDGGAVWTNADLSSGTNGSAHFLNNHANHFGGALALFGGSDNVYGEFNSNSSDAGGGAIYLASIADAPVQANLCPSLYSNTTTGDGGAVLAVGNIAYECSNWGEISSNSATGNGGAIALVRASDVVSSTPPTFHMWWTVLNSNSAGNFGGALYAEDTNVSIGANWMRSNTAISGGAVYLATTDHLNPVAATLYSEEYFADNVASLDGGTFYVDSGYQAAIGGAIYGSTAKFGGAVYAAGDGVTLTGTDLHNGDVTLGGTGRYLWAAGTATISNISVDDSHIRPNPAVGFYFANGTPDLTSADFRAYVPTTDPPAVPTIDNVVAHSTYLDVSLTSPDNGTLPITSIEYRLNGGEWISLNSAVTDFTIWSLQNGTPYTVEVRACNGYVCSDPSNDVTDTPFRGPLAPEDFWVAGGDGSATLSFASVNNGGAAITDFEYVITSSSQGIWSNDYSSSGSLTPTDLASNSYTFTGLDNGRYYNIEFRANNFGDAVGNGDWSTFDFSPHAEVYGDPTPPSNVQLFRRDSSAAFTFTPSDGQGNDITAYQYRVNGIGPWNYLYQDADGNWNTDYLANGEPVSLEIRSITNFGRSSYVSAGTVTPLPVPSQPDLGHYVGTDGQVEFSVAPSNPTDDPITGYQYQIDGAGDWVTLPGTATSIVITGLTNLHWYDVSVRAGNLSGWGDISEEYVAPHLPPPTPDAPTILSLQQRDSGFIVTLQATADYGYGVDFQFSSPEYNSGAWSWLGGCNNTPANPTIYTCDESRVWWFQFNNFSTYHLEFRQNNNWVSGTPTDTVGSVTPLPSPADPTSVTFVGTNHGAHVTVITPSNGGPPITGYNYYLDGVGWTHVSATGSTFDIYNVILSNGSCHSVAINAVNDSGTNTYRWYYDLCPTSGTQTSPDSPTSLVATPGNGNASIAFTPGADGGSAITAYEYRLNGSGSWITASGTTSPITISGLTNGTSYSIELRADNSVGQGIAATAVTVAPRTNPSAPTLSVVTPSAGALAVAFSAGGNGGSAITSFEYRLNGSGLWTAFSGTSSPQTISGLTNGTSYAVEIRSRNVAGASPASSSLSATPRTTPSAPSISGLTPGNGALAVAFTSGDNGGSAITSFEYRLNGSGSWTALAGTSSPQTISGLTNGTNYGVELRAQNGAGASVASSSSSATPRTTPSAPTSLVAMSGDRSISISFAPGSNGGASISTYQWQLNGTGDWHDFTSLTGAVSSVTIPGLTNGTSYTVKLRAVNDAGSGASSSATALTLARTTPSAPTNVVLTPTNHGLVVDFTPGDNGGSAITNYEYSLNGSSSWTALSPAVGIVQEFPIPGLTNGTQYGVRIRAINIAGSGSASDSVAGTPANVLTTPFAPTITGVIAGDGQVTVTFTPGVDGGSAITNYKYTTDGGTSWLAFSPAVTTSPVVISGLTNTHAYSVGIRAVNAQGDGEASNNVNATPVAPAPSNTVAPVVSGTGVIGTTLTSSTGTWSGSGTTFVTTWYACTSAVTSGASSVPAGCVSAGTAATLTPTSMQNGKYIAVGVAATRGGVTITKMSNSIIVAAIAPSVTAAPTITGTAAKGKALTLSTGTWTGTGVVITQQWYACSAVVKAKATAVPKTCVLIKSATAKKFTVTAAQKGKYIAVAVTGTNVIGTKLIAMAATTAKKAV